jgi:hypothetical protein
LVFSFDPRCHGLCGSQKYTRLGNEQAQQVPTGYRPQVGGALPDAVQTRSLPPEIVRQVPDLQTFHLGAGELIRVPATTGKGPTQK